MPENVEPIPSDTIHPAALSPERLLRECDSERLRRSGPGGQHRNKVETAVRLVHRSTGVRGEASERRSQIENRAKALARLRVNLALEVRRRVVADEPASDLWQARLAAGRIHVNRLHDDFPAMLAEALDAVAATQGRIAPAARRLGSTASQLARFLKKEPRAIELVNRWRRERGLKTLR